MKKKMSGSVKWFAGFLCIMAMLTFISRQLYTSKLSVVTTEKMRNQPIAHNINASGTVESDSLKPVFLPQGVLIDSIYVHPGETAEEGGKLVKLNMDSLKKAANELEDEIQSVMKTDGGSYDTENDIPVFTESGIRIMKIHAKPGDKVKKGDILAEADNDFLLRYINSMEADRNKDIVQRNGLINSMNNAAADEEGGFSGGGASQDQIDALTISIDEQQKKINRYLDIYNAGGKITSPADGTVISSSVKAGDTTLDSAVMVISGSGKLNSSIVNKKERLKELKELIKADGDVVSKYSGSVSQITAAAGTAATEQAAMFIADTTEGGMYLSVKVNDKDAKRLAIGDKVTVAFRNGKVMSDSAEIRSITSDGEMFTVQIPVDNDMLRLKDKLLTYGEVGEMRVSSKTPDKYYCIHKDAVYGSGSDRYIYALEESEGFFGPEYHAVRHSIIVADENDTYVGLTSPGLTDDAQIIETTSRKLTDGDRVRLSDRADLADSED